MAPTSRGGGAPPRGGGGALRALRQPLVAGSIGAALLVVVVLIVLNRPEGDGGERFVPEPRAQANGRVEGKPDAPVRIIEYADFQCPFCKRHWEQTAPALRAELVESGAVALEFRHFVVLGPESQAAAEAAECALDQGRFWEMHDLLFSKQGAERSGVFNADKLKGYGRELADALGGVFDVTAYDRCLDGREKRAVVQEMTDEAAKLGIRSTPSFVVGSLLIQGAQPVQTFRDAVATVRAGAGR
jgi:protein-disulfide isomerase